MCPPCPRPIQRTSAPCMFKAVGNVLTGAWQTVAPMVLVRPMCSKGRHARFLSEPEQLPGPMSPYLARLGMPERATTPHTKEIGS